MLFHEKSFSDGGTQVADCGLFILGIVNTYLSLNSRHRMQLISLPTYTRATWLQLSCQLAVSINPRYNKATMRKTRGRAGDLKGS